MAKQKAAKVKDQSLDASYVAVRISKWIARRERANASQEGRWEVGVERVDRERGKDQQRGAGIVEVHTMLGNAKEEEEEKVG